MASSSQVMALCHCGYLVLSFHQACAKKPPRKTADVCSEEADDESPDRERKKQLEPPKKNHKKATSSKETD